MKTRTDLLNHLAEKHNLQRYLEIGVQVPELNFDKIKCPDKVGVDPDPNAKADFVLTSDKFFETTSRYSGNNYGPIDAAEVNEFRKHFASNEKVSECLVSFGIKFDLIFIDGLHTAEQVRKDFENALKLLSHNGFIVLHDCNPIKEEHTIVPRPTPTGHWNGDVWRFAAGFPRYDSLWRYTVDIDNGCTVFWNRPDAIDEIAHNGISNMTWDCFDKNREDILNLITWDEFISIDPHV